VHQDYRITAKLFQAYENTMSCFVPHWQYARIHYQRKHDFPVIRQAELASAAALLLDDPRMRYLQQPQTLVSLDQSP